MAICYQLPTIHHRPSTIYYRPSTINHQPKMKILYIGNKLMKHGLSATSIETLGPLLESEGLEVFYSSDKMNQLLRLFDMLWAVLKYRNIVEMVLIDTYSKRSFYGIFIIIQLCRLLKMKYISILRGGTLPLRLEKSPLLSSYVFRNAYKLIAPSGYLKEKFEEKGYNTIIIPNNIPVNNYKYKKRSEIKPRLLWVRSFHQIYNPEMAIRVLYSLKKEYTDAVLCMVGPDKDTSLIKCKNIVSELGLSDSVIFTGNLSKSEWHKLSEDYDIFINTTTIDNTPVSVIEALALGLPVISTNVGGIPYLLKDKEDSLLVEPGKVYEMLNAIRSLLENKSLTALLSQNGRKKAESFDWSKIKLLWLDILKQKKEESRPVILYLGNKLSKHGLPVSVIETLGPQLETLGYKVYYSSEYKNKLLRLTHMLYSVISKRNIIDKVLIDTYSKYGFWYVYIIAVICKSLKIPYYPILHGGKLPLRLEKNPVLSRIVFFNSAINIAPSHYLKIVFEDKGYKVKYIPNNIDTKYYYFKERKELKPNILFVRSFHKRYNPVMAIEVFKEIKKDYPEATLCMVGAPDSGNLFQFCKKLVNKYEMHDSVVFKGVLPKNVWHKLSESYDIFINTTNVDNMPVSVIEAMSMGLPVVSTNVGGLPYLIEHEHDGLLVNKADAVGMVNEIKRLLSDSELANKLSVNARKKSESFDWMKVKDLWISVL